jgi:hypothetical protein
MSKAHSPGDEHRRLAALAGEWSGEETLAASRWSAGGRAVARVSARMALGGYYLEQDYTGEMDGRTTIEVHAVFAWDEEQRQYLLYWFDSYGFAPQAPGSGQWQEDGLVLTRRSSRGMTATTTASKGRTATGSGWRAPSMAARAGRR